MEAGLIEAHGNGRSRGYILSAALYKRSAGPVAYIRQVGFDAIRQEQMVLHYVDKNGEIKRADVMELCHLSKAQAYRLLKRLVDKGALKMKGEKKRAVYVR